MKTHIYKLFRRTSFDQVRVYYLEGTKADLFALIGYMYSCLTEGTDRIDYRTVPAFEKDAPNMIKLLAHSEDFYIYYYTDTEYWQEEHDCDTCRWHDTVLTEEPCKSCSGDTFDKWEMRDKVKKEVTKQ